MPAISAPSIRARPAAARRAPAPFGPVLQIGMGWLPEQAGGLNRVFYDLVRDLPRAGVALRGLVAGSDGSEGVRAFAPAKSPLRHRLAAARRAVRTALTGGPPAVVASHFALYTAPALDLLRPYPLVVHFHGPWADEGAVEGARGAVVGLKRAVERAVYRRADRFVVLSEAFRDVLVRRYDVDPARVRLVPGGVEASRFDTGLTRREARERLGWPADRPTVLAVRRLVPRMGLGDLVEAAARVRARVPDVLVLIAGRGREADALRAQIAARGLEGHVQLLGFVPDDDLPLAYRAADLTVVPTVALEGFGLIAAESLAAGTPALVTPVGGLPEVVRDLDSNLVLPGTGPDALAGGLTAALTGALGLPDAAACQSFARARYDGPVVARAVRAVYEEAARDARRALRSASRASRPP